MKNANQALRLRLFRVGLLIAVIFATSHAIGTHPYGQMTIPMPVIR